MTDEEKKAIEYFENELKVHWIESNFTISDRQNSRTLLNLIEKQSKMINLMSEQLTTSITGKEWVIKFYEKEAEKNNG